MANHDTEKAGDTRTIITAAGLLLLAGYALHDPMILPFGRSIAAEMIETLLILGQAHGFPKADILRTIFAKSEKSPRVFALCLEVVKDIPPDEIEEVFVNARAKWKKNSGSFKHGQ